MAETNDKIGSTKEANETQAKEIIAEILEEIGDRQCIFRGTPEKYSDAPDGIRSSLYHWARDNGLKRETLKNYPPFEIEKEIVNEATKHFPSGSSDLEVVTALRHFEGKVNVIDFSTDLYVAIFFACTGEKTAEDGEIIFIDTETLRSESKIDYTELSSDKAEVARPMMLTPPYNKMSRSRVVTQRSVFVYSKKGYLDKEEYEHYCIPKKSKQTMLDYLEKFHGIDQNSIYNDLFGFIQNEKNYETAAIWFYRGNAKRESHDNLGAIKDYDEAIQRNPQSAAAHNNRGAAKYDLQKHHEALEDCNKAIQLNPQYAIAYNNRGVVKHALGDYQEALEDYDKAMQLNPQYAEAYNSRGALKYDSKRYREAIDDYNHAIRLNPQYAIAYNNRGESRNKLGHCRDAIKDCDRAIQLNPKYANAFLNRGIAKRGLGDEDEAQKDFKKAQELDPNLTPPPKKSSPS